jgi:hypothetical protein
MWLMTLSLLMLMGVVSEAEELKLHSPYRIVIDGGSTGSRLQIFEFF